MSTIDLQNDKTWTTKDGDTYQIDQLEERHARNILRYLERHAQAMEFVSSWNFVASLPEHMGDIAEHVLMEEVERDGRDPVGWMRRQPAYKAIEAHVESFDRSGVDAF